MNPTLVQAFLFFSIVGVFGDVAMKLAGNRAETNWYWMMAGFASYLVTGFGWYYLLRKERIAIIGPMLTMSNTILIILIGFFAFKETVSTREWLAIGFAISSLALLIKW